MEEERKEEQAKRKVKKTHITQTDCDKRQSQMNYEELRSKSPISSLAFELEEVRIQQNSPKFTTGTEWNTRGGSSSYISPCTTPPSPHSTQVPATTQAASLLPSVQHPIPKKASGSQFSPENSLFVTLNKASQQDKDKVQKCLFPKSPDTSTSGSKLSGTLLRRTQSDFGIGKIRKSLPFDDEETNPLRGTKRPMHSNHANNNVAPCDTDFLLSDNLRKPITSAKMFPGKDQDVNSVLPVIHSLTSITTVCSPQSLQLSPSKENLPPTHTNVFLSQPTLNTTQNFAMFAPLPPSSSSSSPKKRVPSREKPLRLLPLTLRKEHAAETKSVLTHRRNSIATPMTMPEHLPQLPPVSPSPALSLHDDFFSEGKGATLILPVVKQLSSIPYVTVDTVMRHTLEC